MSAATAHHTTAPHHTHTYASHTHIHTYTASSANITTLHRNHDDVAKRVVSLGVDFPTFLGHLSENFNINKVGIAKLTDPPLSGQLISRRDELGIIIQNLCKRNVDSRHVIQTAAPPGYGKSALLTKLAETIMSHTSTATMVSSVCFCLRLSYGVPVCWSKSNIRDKLRIPFISTYFLCFFLFSRACQKQLCWNHCIRYQSHGIFILSFKRTKHLHRWMSSLMRRDLMCALP